MWLFRKEIPDKDVSIQTCRDHFGIILININGGDGGLMEIEGAHKLFVIKIIDGDSAIFIADIDSILSGLDDSDIDIALILIEILERLSGFEGDDGDVLIDTCDDDFTLF